MFIIMAFFLLLSHPAYAGVDFSMAANEEVEVPNFNSKNEAIAWAKEFIGNPLASRSLRKIVDQNFDKIIRLMKFPPDATVENKLVIMNQVSALSQKSAMYRAAIKVIESKSGVGSSIFIGSQPVEVTHE